MWRVSPFSRSFPRLLRVAPAAFFCLYLVSSPLLFPSCVLPERRASSPPRSSAFAPRFAAALEVASPLPAGEDQTRVLELTPNDLQVLFEVEKEGDGLDGKPLLFIAFVAPWCAHCRALHGPFQDAAEVYRHHIRALRNSRGNALAAFRAHAAQAEEEAERHAAAAEARLLALQQDAREEDVVRAETDAVQARQAAAALKRKLGEEWRRLEHEDAQGKDAYPDVLFGRFDCFASKETEGICRDVFDVDRYPSILLLRSLAGLGARAQSSSREPTNEQERFRAARVAQYPLRRPRTPEAIVDFLLKVTADYRGAPASAASVGDREGNGFLAWISRRLEGEAVRLVSGSEELRLLLRPASADVHATSVSFLLCIDARRLRAQNGPGHAGACGGPQARCDAKTAVSPPLEQVHAAIDIFTGLAKRDRGERHFVVALDPAPCTQFLGVLQLQQLFHGLAVHGPDGRDAAAASFDISELHPALSVAAVQPELHLPDPVTDARDVDEGEEAPAQEDAESQRTSRRLEALQVVLSEVWRDQVRTRLLRRQREQTCRREPRERGRSARCSAGASGGERESFCSSLLRLPDDVSLMLAPLFTGPFDTTADTPASSPLSTFLHAFRSPVMPLVSQENFLNLRSSDRTLVLVALDLHALDWMGELNAVALTALLLKTLVRLKRGKWREELLPSFREGDAEIEAAAEEAREERRDGEDQQSAVPEAIVERDDLILNADDVLLIDPSADPRHSPHPGAWKPVDINEMETLLLVEKIWKLTKVASCMYTAERQFASPFSRRPSFSGGVHKEDGSQRTSASIASFTFGIVDGHMFSESLEEYGVYTPGDLPAVIAFPPPQGSDESKRPRGYEERVHLVYRDKERLTLDALFRGLHLLLTGELDAHVEGSFDGEGRAPVVRFLLHRWKHLRRWLKTLRRDASRSWPDFLRIVLGFCAFVLMLLLTVILLISTVCCGGGSEDDDSIDSSDDDLSTGEEEEDEEDDEDGETEKIPTLEEVKRRAERMLRKRRRRVGAKERST
ncbi:hypothetical protein NCLIV_027650 [Neospora caninum Liverpool]|uniref:Thioredoxin domain-containing protein n=1 Tax=Neospora caninum (strain Liverpool) TaxID=572307 RepID=F0VGY2_NEOCL|nr:hypothetical protein NCLIV_027650 [Neospora caninum Liverpool]CBZ52976.1 hypothetical protein NCLIV_027650 [Neospora caninum Liverpool]CEL66962.1 TPA: hypothetical protein BN1204_027650 [Neospora caninum Liverpool]|eukprot:XP_003883008.1 hypothetical protein NCLIV_027650 [Neospora caninum Liverpool]